MTPERMKELGVPQSVERIRSTGAFGHFPGAALASVAHDVYILATPEALAASPEVAKLVAEAEARGMDRAATVYAEGDGWDYFGAAYDAIRAEAAAIRETKT